jgi:hypothetical protein
MLGTSVLFVSSGLARLDGRQSVAQFQQPPGVSQSRYTREANSPCVVSLPQLDHSVSQFHAAAFGVKSGSISCLGDGSGFSPSIGTSVASAIQIESPAG